jgi:hypothetical protein
MSLGRVVPAFNRQPDLQNYECRVCQITVTQSVRHDQRASITPEK